MIDQAAWRRIIRQELQARLSPIKKAAAKNSNYQTSGRRKVSGGRGWPAGRAGLAWRRAGRKKESRP